MSDSQSSPDDFMSIIEDVSDTPENEPPTRTWRILVVDDDKDVHQATKLALKDLIVEDRTLELIHAHSAAEAKQLLQTESDIGVILLDVVMETDSAGLDLVEAIREELKLNALRIILRTGQPGYAPEMETIQRYDINDYRTKPELTRIRLFTILTSAIRAYRQIRNQQIMRQGLEKVVKASTELANLHGLRMFAEGAVKQISAIIQIEPDGLICAQEGEEPNVESAEIIAAAGRFSKLVHAPLEDLESTEIRQTILRCLKARTSQLENGLTLYFSTDQGRGLAAYVDIQRPLESTDRHLLEVFCANLSVGFDNVLLYNKLEEQAFVDPLLKVPNLNRLLNYLYNSENNIETSTLALVDLDDFSAVNDSFGHKFGDCVLKAVAERLTKAFTGSFIARVSSDVFAIVGLEADVTSQRITQVFEESFLVEEQPFKVMASIGLVKLNKQSSGLTELFKDAQVALKQAKSHHRGAAVTFSDDMGQSARDRMQLLAQLRESLDQQALFLMYQPKYKLDSMALTGVEALLRWRNKQGQLIPPDKFIPLAEQSGMMVSIGEFVLDRACQQLKDLEQVSETEITMAINVSPAQLEDSAFVACLEGALTRHHVAPERIELEITETMAANNLSYICKVLDNVRQLGCKIAIDDFGTGFSSLSVLHKLPATRLKIDRSFVDAMEQDDSIAKMIVNLGQTLGLNITAEGIETSVQYEKLKAFGCEEGQGWLFAKAMEMTDLIELIKAKRPQ
ncbi:EAL domain-containing protein [Vibrio sp. T187]|uniref:putative bifunctional diguanylate cyclase/phosphodiesterase n=1 Tax=Vibrio TaxID=662 RepID=UPI0010C98C79|nr:MULTISPECIES: EAL domain-containing protein [Vibrio]MBW3695366.1 EAL domain-containing protein [Vibrio sp. T187]